MIHMFSASLNSTYSQNIAQHLCVWPSLAQTPHLVTLPSVSSLPPSGPFPLSCLSPALSSCLTTATASAGMSAAWRDTHIKMNSPIRIVSAATEPQSFLSSALPHPSPKHCHVYRDCSHSSARLLLISYCTHTVMALNKARLYLRASVLY